MVETVGTVEKVFFVCRVLVTEHIIVLVHDIYDRDFVHKLTRREHVGPRISDYQTQLPWQLFLVTFETVKDVYLSAQVKILVHVQG